jgi:hypothetical protein
VMRYYWSSIIFFSFPSFHEFYRVVPRYKHVLHLNLYMIMLVFVYIFIFGSILPVWGKHASFVFLILVNFALHDFPQLHPFACKPHVIIPCGWVLCIILHCVYTTIS